MSTRNRRSWANNNGGVGKVAAALAALRSYFTDANLPAIYVASIGVTVVTGVSEWDDARGAGYGPALLQATTTKQPIYSVGADGVPVATFGSTQTLQTASTSALFDLSGAYSLALIGAMPQTTATKYAFAIASGASAVRFLGVDQTSNAASPIMGVGGPSAGTTVSSAATIGTTRRLIVVSKDATTNVSIDVPNQARVSGTASGNTASGANGLALGTYFGDGSPNSRVVVAAVVAIARQVTAQDLVQLGRFAAVLNYVPA